MAMPDQEFRAWITKIQPQINAYLSSPEAQPKDGDVLVVVTPEMFQRVRPGTSLAPGAPLVGWFSVPAVLGILKAARNGSDRNTYKQAVKLVQRRPNEGNRWLLASTPDGIALQSITVTSSRGGRTQPRRVATDDGEFALNPAGVLRWLFEMEPEESNGPTFRAAVARFKERVHADMQSQIERGKTPDIDETLARVGNLAGLEASVDHAGNLDFDKLISLLNGPVAS